MFKRSCLFVLACILWHMSGTARGDQIFVANVSGNTIGQYTTSGATENAALISGLNGPYGIAASGSSLFVAHYAGGATNGGTIGAYTTSGATVNASLITGLNNPRGLALSDDGAYLYVVSESNGTIGKYTTSGAVVNAALVTGLDQPEGDRGVWDESFCHEL
jgi:DNA-binding beta-propeller fold protein YncE